MGPATPRVTFDDICRVWPPVSDRDRVAGLAAFEALPQDERRDAVVGAADCRNDRYLAGLSHPLSLRHYLASRMWAGLT